MGLDGRHTSLTPASATGGPWHSMTSGSCALVSTWMTGNGIIGRPETEPIGQGQHMARVLAAREQKTGRSNSADLLTHDVDGSASRLQASEERIQNATAIKQTPVVGRGQDKVILPVGRGTA